MPCPPGTLGREDDWEVNAQGNPEESRVPPGRWDGRTVGKSLHPAGQGNPEESHVPPGRETVGKSLHPAGQGSPEESRVPPGPGTVGRDEDGW